MRDDRIQAGPPDACEPTPEEIERVAREARRLRAQAFWDVMRAAEKGLARAFRRRAVAPAPAAARELAQSA